MTTWGKKMTERGWAGQESALCRSHLLGGEVVRKEPPSKLRLMLLRRFYRERLAQASYTIGCQVTKEAID
jgi:hypothetical protein